MTLSAAPDAGDRAGAEEQALDRYFNDSLMLLGATTAGAMVAPILTLASIPFLVYQAFPLFDQATRK